MKKCDEAPEIAKLPAAVWRITQTRIGIKRSFQNAPLKGKSIKTSPAMISTEPAAPNSPERKPVNGCMKKQVIDTYSTGAGLTHYPLLYPRIRRKKIERKRVPASVDAFKRFIDIFVDNDRQ